MRKYLNDKWLLIIGIPFVGIIMPLVFHKFSFDFLYTEGYRNAVLSLSTTITIWLVIRKIVTYLWKKFPWEKYPFKHIIWEFLLVTVSTLIIGYLNFMVYKYAGFVTMREDIDTSISISITLAITYLITSIHEAWFFYTQWNINLVKAQMLEKENVLSQYETLKTQVNPHFLFNTLNTLTTLIEEDPKKAVGFVEKTSDFLRSILSLKDLEMISLEHEKCIIETFCGLQKERFSENLKLEVRLSAESLKKNVPPLAVQMLIENAIKHNIISSDHPLSVMVSDCDASMICVSNNLQVKKEKSPSSGIGLENIRNRYSLLSGANIEVNVTDTCFEVKLPLL